MTTSGAQIGRRVHPGRRTAGTDPDADARTGTAGQNGARL